MGGALTFPLAKNLHEIRLYCTEHDSETFALLKKGEAHPRLKQQLPQTIKYYGPKDLQAALLGSNIVFLCVNSKGIRPIMNALLPYINSEMTLVTVAKGFFKLNGIVHPMTFGIEAYMHANGLSDLPAVGCMAGPSIASELAGQSPTAVNLSTSASQERTQQLADAFSSRTFHVRAGQDLKGLEICSAFKNIYSIALSWPQGLGQKDSGESNEPVNLKAILMLQALAELELIIQAAGGDPKTARGLAGLGDLVATSGSGRNGRFGKLLASGQTTEEAMDTLKSQGIETVEGLDATPLGLEYVETLDGLSSESLPLLSAIGQVIKGATSPQVVVREMNLKRYAGSDAS